MVAAAQCIFSHVSENSMPQTLLAIMAMVLTSFAGFNQHRSILSSRLDMVNQEVELQSTAVAVNLLEEIGSLAYDEATKNGEITSSNLLTAISLDSNEQQALESAQPDDIDDFNNRERQIVRMRKNKELRFRGRSKVRYMDSNASYESASQTKFKRVTIVVKSLDFPAADSISISKIVSCGSRCNW